MKITAIKEILPQDSTIPDGLYIGDWGGYKITVNYLNKKYELSTEEGVKGIGIKVVVTVKDSIASFEQLS